MARNIYVGNLKWEVTNEDLLELFGRFGNVNHAQVITNKETGKPRGFGFVVMEDDRQAQQAIDDLDGADFLGRPLTVNEARPREERTEPPAPRSRGAQRPGGFRSSFAGGTDRGRRY